MKPERLTLNGITAFQTPIALDFSALPARALVAIVGENGSGKTTILDAMLAGLYRTMPSRGDKPLIDYAIGKAAYIDEVFSVAGVRYRSRVSMDAVTRKADALLQQEINGQWIDLNDGKVSTFDPAVEARFPPLTVVLASAFAAQNRAGSFLTADKKDRKDIFSAMLGLAHYEAMAETCRAEALKLDRRRTELQTLITAMAPHVSDEARAVLETLETRVVTALQHARRAVSTLNREAKALSDRVSEARTVHEQASKDVWAYQAAKADRDRKIQDLETTTAAMAQIDTDHKAELRTIHARAAEDRRRKDDEGRTIPKTSVLTDRYEAALATVDKDAAAALTAIDQKLANQTELLDKAEAIAQAVEDYAAAELEHQMHQVAMRETLTKHSEKQVAIQDVAAAKRALARAEHGAALMVTVPCHGVAPYDTCAFLKDAKVAEEDIPAIRASVTAAEDTLAKYPADLEALYTQIKDASRAAADRMAAAKPLADRKPLLDVAHDRLKDLTAQREAEVRRVAAARKALHERYRTDLDEVSDRQTAITDALRAIDAREKADEQAAADRAVARRQAMDAAIIALTAEIATLDATIRGSSATEAAYETAIVNLRAAEAAMTAHATASSKAAADLATAEAEHCNALSLRTRYDAAVTEVAHYRAALGPVEQDLVEYEVLAKCFGREGLPVLEIDAAGPAVSDLCNDLLRSCFGSARFTVELVTQTPKADGKGFKEVFEIRVYDSERGGEARDLKDLSGGEQVILCEALSGALSIYVNQQNVTPIETCWRDETTGALDPENALRYVAMLRRLQERGGFHHVFYVSHNPEASALADVQLVVKDGTVSVRYTPFGEAA